MLNRAFAILLHLYLTFVWFLEPLKMKNGIVMNQCLYTDIQFDKLPTALIMTSKLIKLCLYGFYLGVRYNMYVPLWRL